MEDPSVPALGSSRRRETPPDDARAITAPYLLGAATEPYDRTTRERLSAPSSHQVAVARCAADAPDRRRCQRRARPRPVGTGAKRRPLTRVRTGACWVAARTSPRRASCHGLLLAVLVRVPVRGRPRLTSVLGGLLRRHDGGRGVPREGCGRSVFGGCPARAGMALGLLEQAAGHRVGDSCTGTRRVGHAASVQASSPRLRRVWWQRRANLRAIVNAARCAPSRALNAFQ